MFAKKGFLSCYKKVFSTFGLIMALLIGGLMMFNLESLRADVNPMAIPPEPYKMAELIEELTGQGPDQIDGVCNNLGIPAKLLNFNLATPFDLTDFNYGTFNLGNCIHIPVQITTREGGRKSLYYLEPGEEVLAGIFVSSSGFMKRYVKRLDGTGVPANNGDNYQEKWTNYDDSILIYQGHGPLEIIDLSIGKGAYTLAPDPISPIAKPLRELWFLWSCIDIKD